MKKCFQRVSEFKINLFYFNFCVELDHLILNVHKFFLSFVFFLILVFNSPKMTFFLWPEKWMKFYSASGSCRCDAKVSSGSIFNAVKYVHLMHRISSTNLHIFECRSQISLNVCENVYSWKRRIRIIIIIEEK